MFLQKTEYITKDPDELYIDGNKIMKTENSTYLGSIIVDQDGSHCHEIAKTRMYARYIFVNMFKVRVFTNDILLYTQIKLLIEDKLINCALENLHYQVLREKF